MVLFYAIRTLERVLQRADHLTTSTIPSIILRDI